MTIKTFRSGARASGTRTRIIPTTPTSLIIPTLMAAVALACGASLASPRLSAQAPTPTAASAPAADEALVKKAKAIHERVITLDTHDDIEPGNFTAEKNYTQSLTTQVN